MLLSHQRARDNRWPWFSWCVPIRFLLVDPDGLLTCDIVCRDGTWNARIHTPYDIPGRNVVETLASCGDSGTIRDDFTDSPLRAISRIFHEEMSLKLWPAVGISWIDLVQWHNMRWLY